MQTSNKGGKYPPPPLKKNAALQREGREGCEVQFLYISGLQPTVFGEAHQWDI